MKLESFFQEVQLPQQKLINGVLFPKLLSPNPNHTTVTTNDHANHNLLNLIQAIESQRPWLEDVLRKSGAIIFRGFPLHSPADFNQFVEATGFPHMDYVGGGASRKHVVGRIYSANDSPPDQKIVFHHELSFAEEFPSKLFFFCEEEPLKGGETPIVLSHIVYKKMNERYPDFIAELEKHGVMYKLLMEKGNDPTLIAGRGWATSFSTNDKTIAEERATKLGMKMEWANDDKDSVKIAMGPKPAFRFDDTRQSKTWFNHIAVAYGVLEKDRNNLQSFKATFGDGRPLPADALYECLKMMDDECVAIPWKKGDVLLIDNLTVLHSRKPLITPPCRILASMCK